MEQIKLFEESNDLELEETVNDFIRNLGRSIKIKDISYSHYVTHDHDTWTAMVRYDDPDLE